MQVVGHDGVEIVLGPVVLRQEDPAVAFHVGSETNPDKRSPDAGRRREFEAVVVVYRLVDQLVLVEEAVIALVVLGTEKDIAVARHLQDAGAVVAVAGSDHMEQVVVAAGRSARIGDCEVEHELGGSFVGRP